MNWGVEGRHNSTPNSNSLYNKDLATLGLISHVAIIGVGSVVPKSVPRHLLHSLTLPAWS